ncbi:MAG: hypothetical protein V4541_13045 [Bacteroidota bacterium]
MGITLYKWDKLKDGYNDGGGLSLWMRTADLVKIGELLLKNGKYKDQQIVSEKWVTELFNIENKLKASWGLKGSLHGYCWYQAKYKNEIVNYAMGYGGQYIFVFPNLDAVIAVNHNHDTAEGIEQSTLFFEKYLPLLYDTIIN